MTEQMHEADEIIPGLWMGGVRAGRLASKGIGEFDAIVNLTGEPTNFEGKVYDKFYVNWRIADGQLPDLDNLDALVEMIANLLTVNTTGKEKRVLVHCTMGVNRSGLVCALVARRVKGLSGLQAVRLVREKRILGDETFVSPGTGDVGKGALINSKFIAYLESLP